MRDMKKLHLNLAAFKTSKQELCTVIRVSSKMYNY